MESQCDELRDKIRNMVITFRNDSNDAIAEIDHLTTQLDTKNNSLLELNLQVDTITAQLTEANQKKETSATNARYYAEKCCQLETQLEERDAEIALLRKQSVGWVQVFDENSALRAEVERLKIELEDEQVLASERKIIIDAHTRQTERYENIYRREFEARQQLKAAEEEIRYLDARIADTRKLVAQECYEMIYHTIDESKQRIAKRYGLEGSLYDTTT